MKKVCYIVSGIDKALAFEWIAAYMQENGTALHFLLLYHREGSLERYLNALGVPCCRVHYAGKKDGPRAIRETYSYLKAHRIEVVHCHLLDAGLVGITAARLALIPKRIYTRHYSSYHHDYHPKGVWYDRWINALSTHLVAISAVVKEIMVQKEGVAASKISVIHHGFPLEMFGQASAATILRLKDKHGYATKYPILGVVARYTHWKGIQYILPAFQEVLMHYPNAHLVLANAKGDFKNALKQQLTSLPKGSYTEIVFEEQLFELFQSFDLFVHAPINAHAEAFGQVYVEAMATGLPCVFTLSGIANEVVVDRHNALVVRYQESRAIRDAILALLENQPLRDSLGHNAITTVRQRFGLSTMLDKLRELYG